VGSKVSIIIFKILSTQLKTSCWRWHRIGRWPGVNGSHTHKHVHPCTCARLRRAESERDRERTWTKRTFSFCFGAPKANTRTWASVCVYGFIFFFLCPLIWIQFGFTINSNKSNYHAFLWISLWLSLLKDRGDSTLLFKVSVWVYKL